MPSLSAGDSARLAADLSRMASAAAANARSRFTGLPFAVIAAQRLTADDRELLIGHLARRLPQEAAPLEERTLLIAERPASASPGDRFDLAYSRRSDGTEDTVEHFEILAALHGRRGVLLLLARDQLSQTTYELLERTADGRWRARWSRTLTC